MAQVKTASKNIKQAVTPRLQMSGVCKSFGATKALNGVDFSVAAGEAHALIGENGAGKSTLMKVLSGAIRPDSGSMRLDGADYAPRHPLEARLRGVAMIYQELSLAPHLSVQENMFLGVEPARAGLVRWAPMRRATLAALAELGHPEIRPEERVGSLSIAARQLVEIGRALVFNCRVLVLDEPTSSLGSGDVERLFALIQRLKKKGLAIVYISHFLEEARRVAERYTVLRDGQSVGGGNIKGASLAKIVQLMVGRQIKELFPRSKRRAGEVMLEVDSLAGGTGKPEQAGFTLRRGEVLGIAGLVGAGRTELLRVLFGLEPIKSGKIKLGVYVGPYSAGRRLSQGMGLLSEDRKAEGLAGSMSIADNLTLSRLSALLLPSRQNRVTWDWIKQLSIKCFHPGQKVSELSGGNQQKVALGRLLYHGVDVLLLDEPTRGIDVASKAQIYGLIDELTGKRGKAVVLVSSYLPELLGVCDRIAVMCRGRLGQARPVKTLDEKEIMMEATGQRER